MPDDFAETIAAAEQLARQLEAHDEEIRARVVEMGARLTEVCKRAAVWGRSANFVIEGFEPAECTYGYLTVSQYGFHLAYRSSFQDLEEADDAEARETYSLSGPQAWTVTWLRAATTEQNLRSLVDSIKTNTQTLLQQRQNVIGAVRKALDLPITDIAEQLSAAAASFGFSKVVDDWRAAQREVHTNPPGAITAACTLVETTLKHALNVLGEPVPRDQSIQPLYRAVSSSLAMSPGDSADSATRGLLQGISSVVQNIGAMRTSVGDAHGKGPAQRDGSIEEAKFAVSVAGALCSYLMHRLREHQRKSGTTAS